MGGAFGALGGDLSAIHVNPGGIGVFRNSEINITPYLDFDKTKSVDKENKTTLLIGNMGIVFNFPAMHGKWKSVNFAFNYVNMNNFNRNILQYGGLNDNSSIIDVWFSQANGNTPDELDRLDDPIPRLAYDVALIDLLPDSTRTYRAALADGDKVYQERYVTERGFQGEYGISLGANYDDKLYIGATLGMQTIEYKYFSEYRERVKNTTTHLDEFYYTGIFESAGSGINLKVGAIYRPLPTVRVGLAIHTPTYYKLSAYGEKILHSYFNSPPLPEEYPNATNYTNNIVSDYDYNLSTPWRLIVSGAVVLNKRGIVSVDYEYVDYLSADPKDTFHGEYDWIRDFFKYNVRAAHNARVGAEFRANSVLSLRGGYAYWGSPYAKGDWNEQNHIQTVSAGMGFNLGNFYTDVAYLFKTAKDTDYFYSYDDGEHFFSSNKIETTLHNHEFRCSFGVKF
jgi:hypothetical protein